MSDGLGDNLRFATRMSTCVSITLGLLACLEAETRLRPEGEHQRLLHKWVTRWGSTVLGVLGVRLHVAGPHLEAQRPYPGRDDRGVGRVFVMNHRSAIDIFATFAHAEAHLMSRHDLADWPFLGRGAKRLGTLFVDRSSLRSGAAVLKVMIGTLKQGKGVALYPEGTAFAGDEVRPFHPGAFTVARRVGAEIVPLGIAYADEAAYYGDESFGAHVKRVVALPQIRAALVAGEPIAAGDHSAVQLRDLTRERVQELVRRARALL